MLVKNLTNYRLVGVAPLQGLIARPFGFNIAHILDNLFNNLGLRDIFRITNSEWYFDFVDKQRVNQHRPISK